MRGCLFIFLMVSPLWGYYDYDPDEVANFFSETQAYLRIIESDVRDVCETRECGEWSEVRGLLLRLVSDDITWGAGSRQQVVTLKHGNTDPQALWIIKENTDSIPCSLTTQIKCDDVIRLEHNQVEVNLHSEPGYNSLLGSGTEITGYGFRGFGNKDDDWRIECKGKESGAALTGDTQFRLRHVNSRKYLNNSQRIFTERNCPRCSIHGHFEISGTSTQSDSSLWRVHSGFTIEAEDY